MSPEKETLGQQIKTMRGMRNLSLRKIEEETGISNAYLSQLENDKIQKPSPNVLHKLAMYFNVSYELFMEAAGYIVSKVDVNGPQTLKGAALFSDKNLTPEEEESLAKYLQFLRSQIK